MHDVTTDEFRLKSVDYHRNGSGFAQGFHLVRFDQKCGRVWEPRTAVVFTARNEGDTNTYAVLDPRNSDTPHADRFDGECYKALIFQAARSYDPSRPNGIGDGWQGKVYDPRRHKPAKAA